MDTFLQLWGGIFYLLNKILLSFSEGTKKEKLQRKLRIWSWILFLIGVPAWIIILSIKRDWIVASIEIGGVPSMILGIIIAINGTDHKFKWLERVSKWCVYVFLVVGISASLYDFGGITSISQVLEICVIVGYLLGIYLLAKKKSGGWLFFMLMNTSMVVLMLMQDKPYLAIQQGISVLFCVYGFIKSKDKTNLQ